MLKYSGLVIWRLGSRNTVRKYSAPGVTMFKADKTESPTNIPDKNVQTPASAAKETSSLVAAAFASLNAPEDETRKKPSTKSIKQNRTQQLDSQILGATDVNSLLVVAENPVVSRRHALKMVSVLSEWSSNNRVKLTEFEKDPRFLKLCRILGRTPASQAMTSLTMAEDLSTVLGITGDDEAARLIANLSLPQMIKVMKALQQKGRRSTPLLRALSYNITKQSESIDLKKSADLLFSMAALNFPDPVLLDRICSDVIENLPSNVDKPAVVSSILVSLGLLKYRHEAALTALADWTQARRAVCRPADIAAAVVTLATVDYLPVQSDALIETALSLKEEEMAKASSWLDLVFSLLILEKAEKHHLTSTLKPEFIEKLLSAGEIPIPSRRKLMTIDAYVGLKFPSTSPRLAEDISVGVPIVYTKEKALYVQSIMDTFKSLVSAETFLRRECQSGMGFIYDAEFAVDSKCHPVPLEKAANRKDVHRIAVLGLDYHDLTRKVQLPLGVNNLYSRLLELKGFKVLEIPYTEFNPKDKLVTRVQYIEKRLKELVSQSNTSRTS
ncbi:FAST kinase domain-containing protein 4 [Maniola hyperantus]|uniref:FAST kinase domain-containing protein 4 n=1 Tax=Aphantopus hyperantus TaxID=2795564 RepID=UPI00156A033B|nr:FAST kinase domain-containing protein 4 [Maniola hyperantus]XP_034828543.1 FAST kinase domain-containing protein 4 [Maniola hyperantus]